jgi:TPP-dependent 2-oxoacid decarboxylase
MEIHPVKSVDLWIKTLISYQRQPGWINLRAPFVDQYIDCEINTLTMKLSTRDRCNHKVNSETTIVLTATECKLLAEQLIAFAKILEESKVDL